MRSYYQHTPPEQILQHYSARIRIVWSVQAECAGMPEFIPAHVTRTDYTTTQNARSTVSLCNISAGGVCWYACIVYRIQFTELYSAFFLNLTILHCYNWQIVGFKKIAL